MNRRQFVSRALTAATAAGLTDLAFLHGLPPVSADEARANPDTVRLTPEMEPLVGLIENTPREKLFEAVGDRIVAGTTYQQLLGAVLLAGVRGIKPRPVGFKFHAVLVINSAHLASLNSPENERWLPLFWALDNFKVSQAANKKEGGWMMAPVDESKLPSWSQAKKRFAEAMDNWDEEGADRAVTALVRSAGANEVIEQFWRYGARDFRDIGHKAIYVANSWRALQTIGWQHAEPVMRSLAFALLEHEGDNPAQRDGAPDRAGRENLKRLSKIRAGWQRGKPTPQAAADLLATLRTANPDEASEQVVELLNKEVDPASVWDGLFLRAGELLMQQPGIVGVHCVTSTNALYFGSQASADDETRRFLLLQAASFLPQFRDAMLGRGKVQVALHVDMLEKDDAKETTLPVLDQILADASKDRMAAARKTLWALDGGDVKVEELMRAARRLIFSKGADSHDYKFSSAALEDYYHASPEWRNRYLATSMFFLRGSEDKENGLGERVRRALHRA
jgi:hypothetical protein